MVEQRRSGRWAEARRNDELILAAARRVFVDDPAAPISAVVAAAGLGVSAVYDRYGSKERLVSAVCSEGQRVYLQEIERGLEAAAEGVDPAEAYVAFLRRIVDADTHALTVRLAGRFTPTAQQYEDGERMRQLTMQLFELGQASGGLRADVSFLDLALALEGLATIRLGDAERSRQVRQRVLGVIIDGLLTDNGQALPFTAPSWDEQAARWSPAEA